MNAPAYKPHAPTPLAPCPMDAGVVIVKMECGCTVEGCGHLPDPVRPKLCAKHAAAPDLYEAARAALESVETWHDDAPRDCDCDDCQRVLPMLRAALAKAVAP